MTLFLAAATLYSFLLLNNTAMLHAFVVAHRLGINGLIGLSAIALGLAFRYSSLTDWMLLVSLLIPFEFKTALAPWPALTPIDYMIPLALAAFAGRYGLQSLVRTLVSTFGKDGLILWGLFNAYALLAIVMLHGSPRGPLRWDALLFFYLVASQASLREDRTRLFRLMTLVLTLTAGIVGAVACIQFIVSKGDFTQATAFFHQHNPVGMYLSLCLPAAWMGYREFDDHRLVRGLGFAVGLPGLVACYSRGAWLGLGVGYLWYVFSRGSFTWQFFRLRTRRISLAVCGLALMLFLTRAFVPMMWPVRIGLTGRQLHWTAAERILRAHPWFGLGPGNYSAEIKHYLSGESLDFYERERISEKRVNVWIHLHNLYLQMLVDYGGVGACLLFLALGSLIRRAFCRLQDSSRLRGALQISIIAFLVHSLFDLLIINGFDFLWAFLLGLARPAQEQTAPGQPTV